MLETDAPIKPQAVKALPCFCSIHSSSETIAISPTLQAGGVLDLWISQQRMKVILITAS